MRGARTGLALVTAVCGTLAAYAQATGWRARPDVVARTSTSQPGFNYDESRVPAYTLPDVLAGAAGRVTSVAGWRARRAEILDLFRDTVYGRSPGRPESLRFEPIETNRNAMGGVATLERVAIVSRQGPRSHRFELTLFLPNDRPRRCPCSCSSTTVRRAIPIRPATSRPGSGRRRH